MPLGKSLQRFVSDGDSSAPFPPRRSPGLLHLAIYIPCHTAHTCVCVSHPIYRNSYTHMLLRRKMQGNLIWMHQAYRMHWSLSYYKVAQRGDRANIHIRAICIVGSCRDASKFRIRGMYKHSVRFNNPERPCDDQLRERKRERFNLGARNDRVTHLHLALNMQPERGHAPKRMHSRWPDLSARKANNGTQSCSLAIVPSGSQQVLRQKIRSNPICGRDFRKARRVRARLFHFDDWRKWRSVTAGFLQPGERKASKAS